MLHNLHSDEAFIQVASKVLEPGSPEDREVQSKIMGDYDVLVRCFRKYMAFPAAVTPLPSNQESLLFRALSRVLEEVRFGMDRARPEALRAWAQAQDLIIERARSGGVDNGLIFRLLKLFQWAQVTPSLELKAVLSETFKGVGKFALRREDISESSESLASFRLMLKSLAKEARGNSISLYLETIGLFAFLSDEISALFASAFVQSDIDIFRDTGILALLNPSLTVRESVLSALNADLMNMNSTNMRRLALIRPWLGSSRDRDNVAMLLEDAHQRGLKPEAKKPARMDWLYISILDGSGCQGVSASSLQGKSGSIYTVLSKIGFGIRSGIYETGLSQRDLELSERHMKRRSQPISQEFVDAFVCNALAESHAADNAIPVEFVGIAEAFGATNWRPNASIAIPLREKLLTLTSQADLEGAIRRTELIARDERFATWFEDGAFIDEALALDMNKKPNAQAGPKAISESLLEGKLEERRERWQKMFFWSAASDAFSKKSKETGWEDRFLVAEALRAGKPLKEIPFFVNMALFSVSQATMRMASASMRSR